MKDKDQLERYMPLIAAACRELSKRGMTIGDALLGIALGDPAAVVPEWILEYNALLMRMLNLLDAHPEVEAS